MKTLLIFLVLTSAAFAQDAKPCGTEAECNATFQKRVAAQEASDKAAKDAKSAEEKAKADALAKMDNKDPQPIKEEAVRHRMELLMARRLLDQQKLQTIEAMIKASLMAPVAAAQASEKAYNDALKELQSSRHAEGCALVYDENGDVKVSKDGKQVWDCSKIK